MSITADQIRNFQPGDFDGYCRLIADATGVAHPGRYFSRRAEAVRLTRPRFDPEADLFLAVNGKEPVGALRLTPEPLIGRVLMETLVRPDLRRRGLGSALFYEALKRVRALGLPEILAGTPAADAGAAKWLEGLGFQTDRRHYEMVLRPESDFIPQSVPVGLAVRPMAKGDEGRLADIQNRAFEGSWGFHPNTADDIAFYLELFESGPEDVWCVWAGTEPVAYCCTAMNRESRGRVHMIGVLPEWRGRGCGRSVLEAGLTHLVKRGASEFELTVDGENKVALKLYHSLGFGPVSATIWRLARVE